MKQKFLIGDEYKKDRQYFQELYIHTQWNIFQSQRSDNSVIATSWMGDKHYMCVTHLRNLRSQSLRRSDWKEEGGVR
jgi:hypothetical protein